MADARGHDEERDTAASELPSTAAQNLPDPEQTTKLTQENTPAVRTTNSAGLARSWAQGSNPNPATSGDGVDDPDMKTTRISVPGDEQRTQLVSPPPQRTSSPPATGPDSAVAPVSAPARGSAAGTARPVSAPHASSAPPVSSVAPRSAQPAPPRPPRSAAAAAAPVSAPTPPPPSAPPAAPPPSSPQPVPPSAPPAPVYSAPPASAPPSLDPANLYGAPSAPPAQPTPPAPPAPVEEESSGKKKKKKKKKGKKKKKNTSEAAATDTTPPLSADGSFQDRMAHTAHAVHEPGAEFSVQGGNVVPASAQRQTGKKQKKQLLDAGGFSGGRWKRFALRAAVFSTLGIIMLVGIVTLLGGNSGSEDDAPPGSNYPVTPATGYAESFLYIYFTWDGSTSEAQKARAEALRDFFPPSNVEENLTQRRLNWNNLGQQSVRSVHPVSVEPTDDSLAMMTFSLLISRQDSATPYAYQCVQMAVYANDGAFAIGSIPSIVACDTTAKTSFEAFVDKDVEADTENRPTIENNLEEFFTAYGANDLEELNKVTTGDTDVVRGLNTPHVFERLSAVVHPIEGESNKRSVYVQVTWEHASSQFVSEYLITVRRNTDNEDRWLVEKLETGVLNPEFAPSRGGPPPQSESEEGSNSSGDSNDQSDGQNDSDNQQNGDNQENNTEGDNSDSE